MEIPASIHDTNGVDVGRNRNLSYLYGLSDFFTYIFEDTSTTNLLMEAGAIPASEIYSNFLQLTSSLTLSGIQTHMGVSIKLLLIRETDRIGTSPVFTINQSIVAAKFLSNRPFMPTETLEEGVDFRVTQTDESSCTIKFAKHIEDYKFSKRLGSDGVTEYAVWITDARIDVQLMAKYYGNLLGVKPEVSSEQFSNFIYGLYYLYMSGPTLRVLEQGLNLVLGIPLSRDADRVIDIRNYLETDQYLVISENNQYVLPTGITPDVSIGDFLKVGTPIAKWVELKDFISSGRWWLNVSIPKSVIRFKPSDQTTRFPIPGDHFDRLMSKYLYKNTFLVRINIGANAESKYLGTLFDTIQAAKASHAQPVYVWRVLFQDDNFVLGDEITSTEEVPSIMYAVNWHPIDEVEIG